MTSSDALLAIDDLTVRARGHGDDAQCLVEGVSLRVPRGKVVGLVGESGSGKSVTALSVLRLLDNVHVSGRVVFDGQDVMALPERALQGIRGRRISMVFQDPTTSLNPVMTVGEHVAEGLRIHKRLGRREAAARAVEMLGIVGIPSPEDRARAYPHELSGGTRQRVMIAMALACRPDLLIADEPTTALDVTVQAQILQLLQKLQREMGMSVLLITHDLGVVAETCDVVYVMHAGRIVEHGATQALFARPRHPYTLGLLSSFPGIQDLVDDRGRRRLRAIPSNVPGPGKRPSGCRFRDRCDRADEACAASEPPLAPPRDDGQQDRAVRCLHPVDTPLFPPSFPDVEPTP